jgi:hypothetical protein
MGGVAPVGGTPAVGGTAALGGAVAVGGVAPVDGTIPLYDKRGKTIGFAQTPPVCYDIEGAAVSLPPGARFLPTDSPDARGSDQLPVFDNSGNAIGFVQSPPELFDADGRPAVVGDGQRFLPVGSVEVSEITAGLKPVFGDSGQSLGFIREKPTVFDADGRPVAISENIRLFPMGAVELGGNGPPFAIRAVYTKDGTPSGFAQVFNEEAFEPTRDPRGAAVIGPDGTPVPAITETIELFDAAGEQASPAGFFADDVDVRLARADGTIVKEVFDAGGHPVKISRMVGTEGHTVMADPQGRPVDVEDLFDANGERIGTPRILTEFEGDTYFVDKRGARIATLADASGRPVAVTGAAHRPLVFDEHGNQTRQTVFRDASGRPLFLSPFTPPAVFDRRGRRLPQQRYLDDRGRAYVMGSLGQPPRDSVFYDENGRKMVLAYNGRPSLFQFCDLDGCIVQRKFVFDRHGKGVGSILLDFQNSPDRLPRAIFASFPEGVQPPVRPRFWDPWRFPYSEPLRVDPLWALSPDARDSFLRIERIIPIRPLWAKQATDAPAGIYDLTKMRKIVRLNVKKVRRMDARPLGDIGLAIKVVRPLIPKSPR